jgi:hypothetical protein
MAIETRMHIAGNGERYVQVMKDGVQIAEMHFADWCALPAVKYAMEQAIEAERQTAGD